MCCSTVAPPTLHSNPGSPTPSLNLSSPKPFYSCTQVHNYDRSWRELHIPIPPPLASAAVHKTGALAAVKQAPVNRLTAVALAYPLGGPTPRRPSRSPQRIWSVRARAHRPPWDPPWGFMDPLGQAYQGAQSTAAKVDAVTCAARAGV